MNAADIAAQVRAALAEDIGNGDLTADLSSATNRAEATVIAREPAVICSGPVRRGVPPDRSVDPHRLAGPGWRTGEPISCYARCTARRERCWRERTALNFLQTPSGTASLAKLCRSRGRNRATVLDTRKTLPACASPRSTPCVRRLQQPPHRAL